MVHRMLEKKRFPLSRISLPFNAVLILLMLLCNLDSQLFMLTLDFEIRKFNIHMDENNFNSFPTCVL